MTTAHRSARRRAAVLGVPLACLTLTATAGTGLAARTEGTAPSLAMAASPVLGGSLTEPGWVAVSGPVSATTTPVLQRPEGGTRRLFWVQQDGATWSVRGRGVAPSAAGAPTTVTSGWHSLNERLAGSSGVCGGQVGRRLLFAGSRTTSSADALSRGVVYSATSGNGASWTVDGANSFSHAVTAISTYGLAAAPLPGGCDQTLAAVTASSDTAVSYQLGPVSGIPSSLPDLRTASTGTGVFAVSAIGGNGPKQQDVYLAWRSLGTSATSAGVHVQQVRPGSGGPVTHAPFSATANGTTDNDPTPVAMAPGSFSPWVAYRDATNRHVIRLWEAGSSTTRTLVSPFEVSHLALGRTPGGRLWISAVEAAGARANPSVLVARTWESGGCVVASRIAVPTSKGSYTNAWQMGAEAVHSNRYDGLPGTGDESLQLWLNASIGTTDRLWYRQVQPRLVTTAVFKPKAPVAPRRSTRSNGGTVVVRASDTCTPVSGAKVVFRGITKKTTAAGTAAFSVGKGTRKASYLAVTTRVGYLGHGTAVRIR